eukprot:TRINITY_DN2288_c0_g1_i1.p1 TRINITY_DN2288_c0_g1~~TRINITY_DN2288_c0_g1_i1.p1  ORF type:complete len:180 (-),score=67.78 TRINITY_DN2288_c0_g1_i1:67-606(-)
MDDLNPDTADDWTFSWSDIISSPGYTMVAGMVCGIVANLIVKHWPTPAAARPLMNMASAVMSGPCKMVLVVRTDVGMGKGKAAAQCAHAAVMCYKKALREAPEMLARWEGCGVTKVCVKVDSEESLLALASHAKEAGVVFGVVRDAGRTQVDAGTMTVLGIGPAPVEVVQQITGHLKLY